MNWQQEVIHFRMFDHDVVHPDPMGCACLRLDNTLTFPYDCELELKRDLEFPSEKVHGSIHIRVLIEKAFTPEPSVAEKKRRLAKFRRTK